MKGETRSSLFLFGEGCGWLSSPMDTSIFENATVNPVELLSVGSNGVFLFIQVFLYIFLTMLFIRLV